MNGNAITHNGEKLLSLGHAGHAVRAIDGRERPASSATIWRWIREGRYGVHLEHVRIGRRIATSREALDRFFARCAEADSLAHSEGRKATKRPEDRKPKVSREARQAAAKARNAAWV